MTFLSDAGYNTNTSRTKRDVLSAAVGALIDEGCVSRNRKEAPRDYLGASQIGDPCARKIQYELLAAPAEPFSGKTLRIFERGHRTEEAAASWLRAAGFELLRVNPNTLQPYGFSVAKGRFRGHVDGVIFNGPDIDGMAYPTIWENKALGAKGWKSLVKDGLAKAYPQYADQIATYQTYMDNQNPALLTVQNSDTMEVWSELVPFDPARAQAASDRAVHILSAIDAGDILPRISDDPNGFPCGWCKFREHCWKA